MPTHTSVTLTTTAHRIAFAAISFLAPWATTAFPLLAGAVLVQKGIRLPQALAYVEIAAFGPAIGTLLSGFIVDRIPRKVAVQICIFAMIACGAVFASASVDVLILAASLLFSTFVALYLPTANVYFGEVHATASRGRALSTLWAFNRLGAAISPLVLLPLLRSAGAGAMVAVIATALLLSSVLWVVCPPGSTGQEID